MYKCSCHDSSIRVPGIVRGLGCQDGGTIKGLVNLSDRRDAAFIQQMSVEEIGRTGRWEHAVTALDGDTDKNP